MVREGSEVRGREDVWEEMVDLLLCDQGLGFRVHGMGLRVWDLGFEVWGLGSKEWGLRLRV